MIILTILPYVFLSGASDLRGTLMMFQTMRMDGDVGFYEILPDQIPTVESLVTIPVFAFVTNVLYPLCLFRAKPLQKVAFGGALLLTSLLGAGVVSLVMEMGYPKLPIAGEGEIGIYNTLPCKVDVACEAWNAKDGSIGSGSYKSVISKVKGCKEYPYVIRGRCFNGSGHFRMCERESLIYFSKNGSFVMEKNDFYKGNSARLRSFASVDASNMTLKGKDGRGVFNVDGKFRNVPGGSYEVQLKNSTRKLELTNNDYTITVVAVNGTHFVSVC